MWITGGRVGALGAHPHPYWIVVLPMAASRGTIAGLLAALVGMGLEMVGLAQVGQLDFAHLFDLGPFGQGVLFLGAAFLIGELHDTHARRFYELGKDLEHAHDENARLNHERSVLDAATHHLRRTVQERPSLRRSLLHGAVRIESRTREALAAAILDLVREQCHASKASIWVVDAERHIHLMRASGWSGAQEAARITALRESARVASVIESATPLNGLLEREGPPLDEPLLLAPLADGHGVLWGILCLDDIEPVYLNTETAEIFFALAEWMTAALTRIDREGTPLPQRGGMADAAALSERLWLENDRAARYGGPLRLVGLQVMPGPGGERADEEAADAALRACLKDFAWGEPPYRFGYPGCYVIVAPLVSDTDLAMLQRHVVGHAAEHDVVIDPFIASMDGDAPDLPALIQSCSSRFRAAAPLPLAANSPVRIPASLRVGDARDLRGRLLFECAISARTHRPLQVIDLRITQGNGAEERALVFDATRATGALRPVDGLYGLGGGRFILLFPFTDPEGAELSVARFLQTLEDRNPEAPYRPIEIKATDPDTLLNDTPELRVEGEAA